MLERVSPTSFGMRTAGVKGNEMASVPQKISEMSAMGLLPNYFADKFTVTGAGSTSHDIVIPVRCVVLGAEVIATGQLVGDYFKVESVDVDNILGFGAGTVLRTPISRFYVSAISGTKEVFSLGYPVEGLQGIYFRFTYTTVNALASVNFMVNFIAHRIL